MSEELLSNLTNCLNNYLDDHLKLTQFLIQNQHQILEHHILLGPLMSSSLYGSFNHLDSLEKVIQEAQKHYSLHQLIQGPPSHPQLRILKATLEAFRLTYNRPMPLNTHRFLTLFPDQELYRLISNWVNNSGIDLHLLKTNGTLTTSDLKEIIKELQPNQIMGQLVKFKGPLAGWSLECPTVHQNGKMINLLWAYQGLGWVAYLTEILEIDNEANLFLRMDGGSNGFDLMANNNFFNSHDPTEFKLITWEKFIEIASEIVSDIPAFHHPLMTHSN